MNRAMRRKTNKRVKPKLTDAQYKDFMAKAKEETVEIEVERKIEKTWEHLEVCLAKAMRENKISEERIQKIFKRTFELTHEKFAKGAEGDERLS